MVVHLRPQGFQAVVSLGVFWRSRQPALERQPVIGGGFWSLQPHEPAGRLVGGVLPGHLLASIHPLVASFTFLTQPSNL